MPKEKWEESWEKHPVLERVIALEGFAQAHGCDGYHGETIIDFIRSTRKEAYIEGLEQLRNRISDQIASGDTVSVYELIDSLIAEQRKVADTKPADKSSFGV